MRLAARQAYTATTYARPVGNTMATGPDEALNRSIACANRDTDCSS